jgi:hypothetical protein
MKLKEKSVRFQKVLVGIAEVMAHKYNFAGKSGFHNE